MPSSGNSLYCWEELAEWLHGFRQRHQHFKLLQWKCFPSVHIISWSKMGKKYHLLTSEELTSSPLIHGKSGGVFFWQITFMVVVKSYSSPGFPVISLLLLWECAPGRNVACCRIPIPEHSSPSEGALLQSQPAVNAMWWICSNVQGFKVAFLCISKFLMANIYF